MNWLFGRPRRPWAVLAGLPPVILSLGVGLLVGTGALSVLCGSVSAERAGSASKEQGIMQQQVTTVVVDTSQVLRQIPPRFFSTGKYTTDPTLQRWAQEAGFALIRVDVLLDAVEPVNDDNDPHHFNWEGFQWGASAGQYGSNLDEVIGQMVRNGHQPLLILHRTQTWNGDGSWQSIPADIEEWAEAAAATVYHFNRELGYGIRYWEIWNEPDVGGEFHGTLGDYLNMARAAARRMKEIDPTIKIGGPVWSHADLATMRQVMQKAADVFDFYSWHAYGTGGDESEKLSDADILGQVESKYGRFARSLRQMIDRYDKSGSPKELALTEFNIDWAETARGQARRQGMINAVWTASVIDQLLRNGVDIAAVFSLTELGILGDGTHPQPVYYLYPLFRQHFGQELLTANVTAGPATLPGGQRDVEAMATAGQGRVQLWLINKATESRTIEVHWQRPTVILPVPPAVAQVWQLAGSPPVRELAPLPLAEGAKFVVPAYSVTILEFPRSGEGSPRVQVDVSDQLTRGVPSSVRVRVTNSSTMPVQLLGLPELHLPVGWNGELTQGGAGTPTDPGSGVPVVSPPTTSPLAPGETRVWTWQVTVPPIRTATNPLQPDSDAVIWTDVRWLPVSGAGSAQAPRPQTAAASVRVSLVSPVVVTAPAPLIRLDQVHRAHPAPGQNAQGGGVVSITVTSRLNVPALAELCAPWLSPALQVFLPPRGTSQMLLPLPTVLTPEVGAGGPEEAASTLSPPLLSLLVNGQVVYEAPVPVQFISGVADIPLDLTQNFTNDGVSWDSDPADGSLVCFPATFPAEELPAMGSVWSALVDSVQVQFRVPDWRDGQLNNVESQGQRLDVPEGRYQAVYVWGSVIGGDQQSRESFGLVYAGEPGQDGQDENAVSVDVPGWWSPAAAEQGVATGHTHVLLGSDPQVGRGAAIAITRVPVDPSRLLIGFVLPDDDSFHVFGVTVQQHGGLGAVSGSDTPSEPAA